MAATWVEVCVILDRWSAAARSQDIDRLVALYAPGIVYFDAVPIFAAPDWRRSERGSAKNTRVILTFTSG